MNYLKKFYTIFFVDERKNTRLCFIKLFQRISFWVNFLTRHEFICHDLYRIVIYEFRKVSCLNRFTFFTRKPSRNPIYHEISCDERPSHDLRDGRGKRRSKFLKYEILYEIHLIKKCLMTIFCKIFDTFLFLIEQI